MSFTKIPQGIRLLSLAQKYAELRCTKLSQLPLNKLHLS